LLVRLCYLRTLNGLLKINEEISKELLHAWRRLTDSTVEWIEPRRGLRVVPQLPWDVDTKCRNFVKE